MSKQSTTPGNLQLQLVAFLIGIGLLYQLVIRCIFSQSRDGVSYGSGLRGMQDNAFETTAESQGDLSDINLEDLQHEVAVDTTSDILVESQLVERQELNLGDMYASEEEIGSPINEISDDSEPTRTRSLADRIKGASAGKKSRSMADLYAADSGSYMKVSDALKSRGLNIKRATQEVPADTCAKPSPASEWIAELEILAAHQCANPTPDEIKEMYMAPGGMAKLMSRLAGKRADEIPQAALPQLEPKGVKLMSRRTGVVRGLAGGLNIKTASAVQSEVSAVSGPHCHRKSAAAEWIEMLGLEAAGQCGDPTPDDLKALYVAPGGLKKLMSRLSENRGDDSDALKTPSNAPSTVRQGGLNIKMRPSPEIKASDVPQPAAAAAPRRLKLPLVRQ